MLSLKILKWGVMMNRKLKTLVEVFIIAAVLLAGLIYVTRGKGVQYAVENKAHVVTVGETGWDIACQYLPEQDRTRDVRELLDAIGRANDLQQRDWNIQPGEVLIIPLAKEKH